MHDSRGAALKVGDRVLIEAEVKELCSGDDTGYCNVTIKVVTPHQAKPPEMDPPSLSAINTRMLTKIGAAILAAFVLCNGPVRGETADPKPLVGFEPKSACECGEGCQCKPGQCPGNCAFEYVAAAAGGRWKQQCDGKKCYWVWVPDSEPDPAPAAPAVAPVVVQAAVFSPSEVEVYSAKRRGVLGRIVDAIRDREPLFPNRPRLRGGWLRGGCSSCQ